MTTWRSEDGDEQITLSRGDWIRAVLRGIPLAIVVFGCLAVLLIMRLPEYLFFGKDRRLTPYITTFVCRTALRMMGVSYRREGEPMKHAGAMVANHASWLDIFSLNSASQIYFVAKAEVAKWPGIGWLARATGTVFIARDPRDAANQKAIFEERLKLGHRLTFFPEGTSTDGLRVLPFKSTLFAAFFAPDLREVMWVQPVTVQYQSPEGENARFYGWWGDMDFGPHFLRILGARRQGGVTVIYHMPLKVGEFSSRKDLASASEAMVRQGLVSNEAVPSTS